jgi:hypothetical protein
VADSVSDGPHGVLLKPRHVGTRRTNAARPRRSSAKCAGARCSGPRTCPRSR